MGVFTLSAVAKPCVLIQIIQLSLQYTEYSLTVSWVPLLDQLIL